jgi:hypothetical protein
VAEISPAAQEVARAIHAAYRRDMHLGKLPKLALTCSRRRIRIGVSHHGSASTWTAPAKDHAPDRKANKKRR